MINLLKKSIEKLNLDYFLLPNCDEFNSEYLPKYAKRLEFITNFTGSNGFAIIGNKKSAFFTDGRYTIQSKDEINESDFNIFNLSDKSPLKWLLENCTKSDRIGFDPKNHSIKSIQNYQKFFELISLAKNPVDEIWPLQPQYPKSDVFDYDLKYCGESKEEKIKKIIKNLESNCDLAIITDPASICWLFNIRSSDIEYSPLYLCYALISKDGKSWIFPREKAFETLEQKLETFAENTKIQIDFHEANYQIYQILQKNNFKIINQPNPCLDHKAIKNQTEIRNTLKAHQLDGLAVTKFLFWLEETKKEQKIIDELEICKKLLELRKQNKSFCYPSFATIAGFGPNGAIIHYQPNKTTNKKINPDSLLLIDSGGQYFEGTTDITRTISIGTPTPEMIKNFTLVLKGHIALATIKFPYGTTGDSLDILARQYLWQEGYDYEHGTGHGVGSFLSVHESPPSISKRPSAILQEGMILSNEPGFYEKGKYGIRIENLILVKKSSKKGFLEFQTLTLAPINYSLIDFEILNDVEKKWLTDYHLEIYEKLKDGLSENEKKWLGTVCEFLSKKSY